MREHAAEIATVGIGGKQDAEPELGKPRVGKGDSALREPGWTSPHDAATLNDGSSANVDLGAELVDGEPLKKIGHFRLAQLDQEAVPVRQHEEIERGSFLAA